jgi:SAM-dependent methyltransferase
MLPKSEVLRRWKETEPLYLDNGPRRAWIANIIRSYCPLDGRILELGCNAGKNLEAIHALGYSHLYGVDINDAALDAMQAALPTAIGLHCELSTILNFEKLLQFDVVFSLAVLMHIHPDDRDFFKELHKITKGYLICAEWTKGENDYIKPIDPKDFEGFDLIRNEPVEGLPDLVGYSLYVFKKKET